MSTSLHRRYKNTKFKLLKIIKWLCLYFFCGLWCLFFLVFFYLLGFFSFFWTQDFSLSLSFYIFFTFTYTQWQTQTSHKWKVKIQGNILWPYSHQLFLGHVKIRKKYDFVHICNTHIQFSKWMCKQFNLYMHAPDMLNVVNVTARVSVQTTTSNIGNYCLSSHPKMITI